MSSLGDNVELSASTSTAGLSERIEKGVDLQGSSLNALLTTYICKFYQLEAENKAALGQAIKERDEWKKQFEHLQQQLPDFGGSVPENQQFQLDTLRNTLVAELTRLNMMTLTNNVSSQEGSKGKVEEAFNMEHEFVTMSCAKGDLEVAHLDPDGHFIELVNHGGKQIRLTSWRLALKSVEEMEEVSYTFPENTRIAPEGVLRVWSFGAPKSKEGRSDLAFDVPGKRWLPLTGDRIIRLFNSFDVIIATRQIRGKVSPERRQKTEIALTIESHSEEGTFSLPAHYALDYKMKDGSKVHLSKVDPKGTFIEIQNLSDERVFLNGWAIYQELDDQSQSDSYFLGEDHQIGPFSTITIWGSGSRKVILSSDLRNTMRELRNWMVGPRFKTQLRNEKQEVVAEVECETKVGTAH